MIIGMAEIVDRLSRFYSYAYKCEEKATYLERLWWKGYIEAFKQIMDLLKGELKK